MSGRQNGKNLVIFIYRDNGVFSRRELHRKLFGSVETRVTKDEYGRVKHKQYSYSGVLAQRWYLIIKPYVFLISAENVEEVSKFFQNSKVPHLKIYVNSIKNCTFWAKNPFKRPQSTFLRRSVQGCRQKRN